MTEREMAILVTEMPTDCNYCRLKDNLNYTCFASIASLTTYKSDVEDYAHEEEKPEWCPLKPMEWEIPSFMTGDKK